jgi:DNA polymerase III epsilon subunit
LPEDWESRSSLAIDVETTGLDARRCRIVEIGAILFSPVDEHFEGRRIERLIDPGITIPSIVIAVHGITDEDVKGQPAFADIASELIALAEGAILVAHNAPFDLAFIQNELTRAALSRLPNPSLDCLVLARAAFPGQASYSLPKLATALRINSRRSHRALDDAIAAARIFVEAGKKLKTRA